jgi:hypothetical protein
MQFKENSPPRSYKTGLDKKVVIKDCGRLMLEPDEQVTFLTDSGCEYDVTRKDWGFYATPSLNVRLERFHLRAVLVRNASDRYFVMLVEKGKERLFDSYIRSEALTIVCWVDSLENLQRIEAKLSES